jgi:hypothetical protein
MNARRARALRLGWVFAACAAAAFGLSAAPGACTRHADIRDEPDAGGIDPNPELDAGDIPGLDSGLGTDAYTACAERPIGDCQGTNDFPCDFTTWANSTAASCQVETSCVTNGWLEVKMGADGCVVEIGMTQPNDEIVACLLEEFGAVRCPCGEREITYFFGQGNQGLCPDAGPPG